MSTEPTLFLVGPAPTKRGIVVLVTGSRDFTDRWTVFHALDYIHNRWQILKIVNGGARGADEISTLWALSHNLDLRIFPADWDKHGKAAGAVRNRQMLQAEKPDLVVAFPVSTINISRGTADMIKFANQRRVTVAIVNYHE